MNVLTDAVTKAFGIEQIKKCYSIAETGKKDILIIISPQTIITSRLFIHRKRRFIYWFQGVAPEEIRFLYKGFYSKLKAFILQYVERYILKNAILILFVSEKMRQHYASRYGYKKDNYIIMPCFNQYIDKVCFTASKYSRPTFVYAGNMALWQCPEEMITLFSAIKKYIPEATLTILTPDHEDACKILAKQHVAAEIKYVSLKNLSNEMAKYKYGFLLRKKMIINEVATPTKINSYMASGIIPILSNVIGDFNDVLRPVKYVVMHNDTDYNQTINRILEIEKQGIDINFIINEYSAIFDSYYNRKAYVSAISEKLHAYLSEKPSS
jgi:glycosyltransferase involved in cell wall biosynthesis